MLVSHDDDGAKRMPLLTGSGCCRLSASVIATYLQVAKDAVVVEADAIKNRDVVYRQLSHSLPSSSNIAAEVGTDITCMP